ncbi:hypothetical protein [Caulobacter sp. FWC2]|uniref:hypothetical protein n=1 Tax=Caulobacter sp. FWC2 TaxID=69664 RepID=UPI0013046FF0|nr:hypothetical protein [Caulobacter sp. FWC2]
MSDYVTQALQLRLADLEGKLKARKGQAGFAENVEELKAAIAALKAEIASREG